MITKNIVEKMMIPHNLPAASIVNQGQYFLFAPVAKPGCIGMAMFKPEHFLIDTSSEVSINPTVFEPYAQKSAFNQEQFVIDEEQNTIRINAKVLEPYAKRDEVIFVKNKMASSVFVTDGKNDAIMIPYSVEPLANNVPVRTQSGAIMVPNDNDRGAAAQRGFVVDELNKKVSSTGLIARLYGTKLNGGQTTYPVGIDAEPSSVVQRNGDGDIYVKNPTSVNCAVPQRYVDELVSPITERVSILEELTLTHLTDTSSEVERVVPNDISPKAVIKSLGGHTLAQSSNLFDTATMDTWTFGGDTGLSGSFRDRVNYHTDSAGTMYFTLAGYEDIGCISAELNVDFEDYFTPGVYEYMVDGAEAEFLSDNRLVIYVGAPFDEALGDYSGKADYAIRLMIRRIKDDTGYTVTEVPTMIYEPYHTGGSLIKIAKIESHSKNYITFPYDDIMSAGYVTTKNGLTLRVNKDKTVSVTGRATVQTDFLIMRGGSKFKAGHYILAAPPKGVLYMIEYYDLHTGKYTWTNCSDRFEFDAEGGYFRCKIRISKNTRVSGVKYLPFLGTEDDLIDTFVVPDEILQHNMYGEGLTEFYFEKGQAFIKRQGDAPENVTNLLPENFKNEIRVVPNGTLKLIEIDNGIDIYYGTPSTTVLYVVRRT